MTSLSWYNCIPRARLYLKYKDVLIALFQLLLPISKNKQAILSFEEEFCSLLGVSRAIAAPYARTSLYHILIALELPPRSEVITTPITIHDIINVINTNFLTSALPKIKNKVTHRPRHLVPSLQSFSKNHSYLLTSLEFFD